MRAYCGILAAVLVVGGVGTTSAIAQTASRIGPSIPAISAVVKGSAVAYDTKNSMYLVVSAYGDLNGRFVSADGALIGAPFTIQPGTIGTAHFPGVAYSPDANAGAGGFLVAWHQSSAVGARAHARMVSPTGVLGPEQTISADGSWWEATADVAYSTVSKEFFVTWQAAGIRAQRIGNAGEMIGANIYVTGTDYHRDPAVAYNPSTNEFMVVFAGADAGGAHVSARRVAAGTGALVGPETLLARAPGTYITEVAYNPTTNQYLAAWYQGGTFGRLLDAAGNVASNVLVLSTRFTAYDGLALDYNTASGTFILAAPDTISYQNGAVELSGAGAVPGVPFVATETATTIGNFYPKIAARTGKGEWLLSTATSFMATTVQRLGSTAVGVPPAPPCVATPTVTSLSPSERARDVPDRRHGSGHVRVDGDRAPPRGCRSRRATAPRATQASGSPSPATCPLSRAPERSQSPVAQSWWCREASSAAATHDINGDGGSDLVWQHQTNGQLATWYMHGATVVGTQSLSIPAVADTNWKVVGTGDLNGDGFADLVWQHATSGSLATWALRGSTVVNTQLLSIPVVADTGWKINAVGDLNGDGRSDIVWQHATLGTLAVWLMNGSVVQNTLLLSIPIMPDPNWQIAGAGDINGDGRADLIWQNHATGGLAAWQMNGATVGLQRVLSHNVMLDTAWTVQGVGDVSGDGAADLIFQRTDGNLAVWYLNGFNVIFQGVMSIDRIADSNWKVAGPG